MADPRINPRSIRSPDIPTVNFSTTQISGLEQIAVSTANEAAKLQQTSEKLFLSNFEKDARQAINEISERNKSDPENLKKGLIESAKGFSENAPFQLKGLMEAQYEIMGRPMINNAVKLRTKINNDQLKESSLTNITESFKNLEQSSAGMLSDDAHVAFDASRSAQLQLNTIESASNMTGEDGSPLFGANQRVSLIEKAKQSLVGSGVMGWFEGQTDKVKAYKDFTEGKKTFKLYDPEGNVEREIDPLFEMNRGTFEKTRRSMESDIKQAIQQQAQVASMANFKEKFDDGSLLIDPKNKAERSQVNTYFDEVVTPQTDNMNSSERNDVVVDFVNRVGVLPSTVKGIIRSSMRNGSVENQTMAADLISKVQESKPQALAELDGSDVSYALMLTKNLRGGLTPDEAVAQTKLEFNPIQSDLISLRKKDFKDLELQIDSEKDLKSEFARRPWSRVFINQTQLSGSKDNFDQTRIDYISEYERQYVLTGDQKVSQERASTIIGRQYGVTEVSGTPRVIKYPPENYYAVEGLSNEWMSKQMVKDVRTTLGKEVTKEDIALVADTQTSREVSSHTDPSYSVLIRNDRGEYEPAQKDNRLMRFKFDSSIPVAEHNAEIKREQEEALIKGQKDFDDLRKAQKERFKILTEGLKLAGTQLDAINTN